MRDYLALGPVPADEACQQVGMPSYDRSEALAECKRYQTLLSGIFGTPPGNARFGVKSFPHDFGTYHEVCIFYDDASQSESEFAFIVENNLPATWDDVTLPQGVQDKLQRLRSTLRLGSTNIVIPLNGEGA